MIGYTYGLNAGLLHIIARMDKETGGGRYVSSVRMDVNERAWLLRLREQEFDILDKVPVSLFRFNLSDTAHDGMPDDDNFRKAAFNVTLISEVMNYIYATDTDSLVVCGINQTLYNWFILKKYSIRLRLCDSHRFFIRMAVDPTRLKTDESKESALLNTSIILSADLKTLQTQGDFQGIVEDYGSMPHELEIQMKAMIEAGVRPLLVSACTGLNKDYVNNVARNQKRSAIGSENIIKGRTPKVTRSFERNEQQATLYMLIYSMIGANTRLDVNAKAAIHAHKLLLQKLRFMGYRNDELMSINDAINIVTGTLSGELYWRECPLCRYSYIDIPDRATPCPCCS
jgi:hypothetical protein